MNDIALPAWAEKTSDLEFKQLIKEHLKVIKEEKLPCDDLEFLYAATLACIELSEKRRTETDEILDKRFNEIKAAVTLGKIAQIGQILGAMEAGYSGGIKAIPRKGAEKTNSEKSKKVGERRRWYSANYQTMLSIDPKKRLQGKIATVAEMQQTLADKFNVSIDTAKNDIAFVRKALKSKRVIR